MLYRRLWRSLTSLSILLLAVGLITGVRSAGAESSDAITRLDRIAQYVKRFEAARRFDRNRLYGVNRNLAAFAERWPALRERLLSSSTVGAVVGSAAARGPISTPTLQISRYAGFTQSQTATAWCGSSVITFFNDTGSEAKTMAALSGVTAVGFAASSNQGRGFAYQGAPPGGINLDQSLIGSPTVACASVKQWS